MNKNTIPTTARQAFKILDAMLTPEDIAAFCAMSASEFSCNQHFGLGMWIRNNWIYGPGEEDDQERELRDECYRMLAGVPKKDYMFEHPDTVSGRFLERYHRHLKKIQKK